MRLRTEQAYIDESPNKGKIPLFKLSENQVAALTGQTAYSLITHNYRQEKERSHEKMELDNHVTLNQEDLQRIIQEAVEKA